MESCEVNERRVSKIITIICFSKGDEWHASKRWMDDLLCGVAATAYSTKTHLIMTRNKRKNRK